ncbi:MAG TPA: dienelactone hydrolase family protein [Labilithrix sp.]|nr:dienelactone hydrolase family protein [Labilithrix sp.]
MTTRGDAPIELDGFTVAPMTFDGVARHVYRGGSGPGVIVIHEIPGITPEVARFARRVKDAGFTVFMPSLFGTPGRPMTSSYAATEILKTCVSREFRVFAAGSTSPVVGWLRALCAAAHAELGGPGVGAIGMCMTGNFALALMVDPSMMAPVLSQPSLPVGLTRRAKSGLHLSAEDLAVVKRRSKDGVPLLALRFTNDPMCPKERFERLRSELASGVETIEIDSSPGNAHGIPRSAHSVVTLDLVDQAGHPTRIALDRVLSFFRERLSVPAQR